MTNLNLVVMPKGSSVGRTPLKKTIELPFAPTPGLALVFPVMIPILGFPVTFWVHKDFLFYEVACGEYVAATHEEDSSFDDYRGAGFVEVTPADLKRLPSLRMCGGAFWEDTSDDDGGRRKKAKGAHRRTPAK